MRSTWTEDLRNVVRHGLDTLLSPHVPASGEDNNLTNDHSHPSYVTPRKGGSMPQQAPRQYLTKRMNLYIRDNDPAQNDPITIEDDDDAEEVLEIRPVVRPETSKPLLRTRPASNHEVSSATQASTRQMPTRSTQRERDMTAGKSIDNSQSADEIRLLGGVRYQARPIICDRRTERCSSKSEPGSVTIQDPMKQSSNFKSPYRPVDTLNRSRASARSGFVGSTPISGRLPQLHGFKSSGQINEDTHNHRHKRRKLEQPQKAGQNIQDAIDLGNSQKAEDSVDELGMSPAFQNGKTEQPTLSPPEKGSTRKTSPSRQSIRAAQGKTTSAYFGKTETSMIPGAGVPRTRQLKSLGSESPDALQDDYRQPPSRSTKQHPTSLDNVPATAFTQMLVGSDKSMAIRNPTKKLTNIQNSSLRTFKLLEFVSDLWTDSVVTLEVDERRKQLRINTDIDELGTDATQACPMEKIIDIKYGSESNLVSLDFSRSGNGPPTTYLRFESEGAADEFVKLLQEVDRSYRVKRKDSDWMETALSKTKADIDKHQKEGTTVTVTQTKVSKKHTQIANEDTVEKRTRHVDRLDLPAVISGHPTVITGAQRRGTDNARATQHAHNAQPKSVESDRREISQTEPSSLRRVTRSQESGKKEQCDRIADGSQSTKTSNLEIPGGPWRNDLRYAISEKRTGSVPYEDLGHLGHEEFLNDNLISFFVHYLESKINSTKPELSSRIHIFNTYFFETLTKTSKGQKGRGINYEGVSKWTKAMDLFKRDFVVVPVNENFHWYLAIICNLPYFLPESEQPARQGLQPLLLEDPSTLADGNVDGPTTASEEQTQRSLAELSISDNDISHQIPSNAKGKKRPARRRVSRLPKYDTDKPVIITLDSLGTARPATTSILKQYVVAEAKNKKGLDLEPSELRGMTAKEIPTQRNFSDCGLYLCMYLEQFVANPDTFVYNILQREGNAHQWPETIRGHDLRERLRDLLLELHRRQEHEEPEKEIPEVGSIMIDKPKRPPPTTQHPLSLVDKGIDYQRSGLRRMHDEDEGLASHADSTPAPLDTDLSEDVQSGIMVDDPGILDGANSPSDRRRPHAGSNLGPSPGEIVQVTASSPISPNGHRFSDQILSYGDPAELASHLRTSRKRQFSYRDDDEAQQQIRPKSASTDFLSGMQSYPPLQDFPFTGENSRLRSVSARRIPDDEVSSLQRKRTRHSEQSAINSQELVIGPHPITEATESNKHRVLVPRKKRQYDMDEVEIYEDTEDEQTEGCGKA
ncbi:uncharacterized protein PV06_05271 [Exophiala oligosperma]|uniref:Ubiquitin-like protease family profile domain-containing protein n=2 Tax=Chaetothyriales TaxID=34395 RepID=A0A0D2DNY1_9EURO|nr:uncharacterized protein PV06_05271 [Exophiala oligosperma]KAJ9644300.1 hypothetical protein H2204_001651 [Knufia peltigerae]KIW44245.1 hypothetical protein PV06_05271 [Exophiala oligosperma]